MKPITLGTLALILLLALAACGRSSQADSQPGVADDPGAAMRETSDAAPASGISGAIQKAMRQAKQELASKNVDVNGIHIGGDWRNYQGSLPKAEITPQGELLIGGKKVAATPAQQALLLDYRRQIVGVAEAGMDIGTQGADLGIQASKAALWGAFAGKSGKDVEASIKPQTDRIRAAALKLCKRLPDLLSSQQRLAAAMPAFRPYATMEQKDIDDCGKEMTDKDGKKGFAAFSD